MRFYVENAVSDEWEYFVVDSENFDEPVAASNDESIADIVAASLNNLY